MADQTVELDERSTLKLSSRKQTFVDSIGDQKDAPIGSKIIDIAKQAEKVYKRHPKLRKRHDTYFYKVVVLGRNVEVADAIITYMDDPENGLTNVLDWLLRRGQHKMKRATEHPAKLCIHKGFIYFLLVLLHIMLTPVFYAAHSVALALLSRKKKRITKNIKLPLVYALFSQTKDMWKYFLKQGIEIEDADSHGNNLFHYIADLSSEAPERSVKIFNDAVQLIPDTTTLKYLMIEQSNAAGLTAIEYASKFGSPELLTQMLNHPNVLSQSAAAANEERVVLNSNNEEIPATLPGFRSKIDYIDVTMYEEDSFAKKSALLKLLSDRRVCDMSKSELSLFSEVSFIGNWMSMKVKQMFAGVALFHLVDIIVTGYLLVIVTNNIFHSPARVMISLDYYNLLIKELSCHQQNESFLFKTEAYPHVFRHAGMVYSQTELSKYSFEAVEELENEAISNFPDIHSHYENNFLTMMLENCDLDDLIVEKLISSALKLDTFKMSWDKLTLFKNIPLLLHKFSLALHGEKPYVFKETVDLGNVGKISKEINALYHNFSVLMDDTKITPFQIIKYTDLICLPTKIVNMKDINFDADLTIDPILSGDYYDICDYKLVKEMTELKCSRSPHAKVYDSVTAHWIDNEEWLFWKTCMCIMLIITMVNISFDILERCVFVFKCMSKHSSVIELLESTLNTKLPGSYARKQINIFTYILIFVFIMNEIVIYDFVVSVLGVTFLEAYNYMSYIIVISLVFRFVMHIHSMRLLPGFGHFVNTTFMMATNLFHFSAVFGIVLLIFSIIFNTLIVNPDCPVESYKGFESISRSIFSTFQLAFGHGNLEPFMINLPVKLTYMIYVVIVSLLLLNLIIAIMTTTATEIMAEPWRETLWRMEWLKEALSVEFTFSVLMLCCKCFPYLSTYYTHKRAGFMVKKHGTKCRLYIEAFSCPQLH